MDTFDMSTLKNLLAPEVLQSDVPVDEEKKQESEIVLSHEGFFELDKIFISSVRAAHVPVYDGSQNMKLQLFLGDKPLQLHCPRVRIRHAIRGKYEDDFGRPKLNFTVDLHSTLCNVLQICDRAAQNIVVASGSTSKWTPVVIPLPDYPYSPTARINIPRDLDPVVDRHPCKIYQKEFSGATVTQRLIYSNPKAEELESLFNWGTVLDAFVSVESYDYKKRAGIRLVARNLVIDNVFTEI